MTAGCVIWLTCEFAAGQDRPRRAVPPLGEAVTQHDWLDMPYDQDLAARIREVVAGEPGLSEKKMFGGLAFLVNGNMAVAASAHGGLMVRVDPAESDVLVSATAGLALPGSSRRRRRR
jgi:hypothetical protein